MVDEKSLLQPLAEKQQTLEEKVDSILPNFGGLSSNFLELKKTVISSSHTTLHVLAFKQDANKKLRESAFIEVLIQSIIDYVIPKRIIREAKQKSKENSQEFVRLYRSANKHFIRDNKSGEVGELILYYLANEILHTPQLICKMSLKDNYKTPVLGADAIHFKFTKRSNGKDLLEIYWGEAKMYSDYKPAIKNCLDGLSDYLIENRDGNSRRDKDVKLILANSSTHLADENLSDLICTFFDEREENSLNLVYKGIGFVSCDSETYDNYKNSNDDNFESYVKGLFQKELVEWERSLGMNLKKTSELLSREIYLFVIPFKSVESFRENFLKSLS